MTALEGDGARCPRLSGDADGVRRHASVDMRQDVLSSRDQVNRRALVPTSRP